MFCTNQACTTGFYQLPALPPRDHRVNKLAGRSRPSHHKSGICRFFSGISVHRLFSIRCKPLYALYCWSYDEDYNEVRLHRCRTRLCVQDLSRKLWGYSSADFSWILTAYAARWQVTVSVAYLASPACSVSCASSFQLLCQAS